MAGSGHLELVPESHVGRKWLLKLVPLQIEGVLSAGESGQIRGQQAGVERVQSSGSEWAASERQWQVPESAGGRWKRLEVARKCSEDGMTAGYCCPIREQQAEALQVRCAAHRVAVSDRHGEVSEC